MTKKLFRAEKGRARSSSRMDPARRRLGVGLLGLALVLAWDRSLWASPSPVDYANPLVGTAPLDKQELIGNAPPPGEELYTGFTLPGPAFPHAQVNLGPINKDLEESAGNHGIRWPYTHPRQTMLGFSSRFPGMTLMPLVGDWTVPPDRSYAAVYDKKSEHASPGYYSVDFADYKIRVELTATEKTGMYRFTFPRTEKGVVLLDLGPGEAQVEIVGDHTVQGTRAQRGARYFVAEFSKPFKSFGTFRQEIPRLEGGRVRRDDVVEPGARSETGSYAGCYLTYATSQGEAVLVKVAVGDSYEQARQTLASENPGWDFDSVRQQVRQAWSKKLDLLEVQGGTEQERRFFYSALYHALSSPRLMTRKGESFRGLDRETHVADCNRYSPVAFWDTGRDQIALLMLLEPDLMQDVLRTHLERAQESGWMDTSFHGDHAVLMFLGAWERGFNFDWKAAYEFLRKNAMDPRGPRGHLAEYLKQGWIHDVVVPNPSPPYAGGNAGADKTLEYSWDDFALGLYAKKLGLDGDYRMFLARSQNYTNVYDPAVGFMRGRNADGSWISPFDPQEPYYNFMMKEASGWQNLWLVPHDVPGLMQLLGGREDFCRKLDEFFTLPYHPKGIARDVTGMLGQYCQGNQPDWQTAYFYDYAGEPWRTQELVRQILTTLYGSDQYGLGYPGMDDQGASSAWYVLSAMGFYTVNPALPQYIIGSPLFSKVTLHLGNGKDFVIVANHNSGKNKYIQSATLNGQPWSKPWFSHSDIANGGRLVFEMGAKPNRKWGSAPDAAPPSGQAVAEGEMPRPM